MIFRKKTGVQAFRLVAFTAICKPKGLESNIWQPTSGIEHLESNIWQPTSGSQHLESNIWQPTKAPAGIQAFRLA